MRALHNPGMMQQTSTTSRRERITEILTERFAPETLTVQDDSARHAGHVGRMQQKGHAPDADETHFRVAMVSPRFAGMSRVERSRAVHEALAAEFASGLHALNLALRAPGEG